MVPAPTPLHSNLVAVLRGAGVERGADVGLALHPAGTGIGLATRNLVGYASAGSPGTGDGLDIMNELAMIEVELRPRWVWWGGELARLLVSHVRPAKCWDLAVVDRLIAGGYQTSPAIIWARSNDLDLGTIPRLGQMGLLDAVPNTYDDPAGEDSELPVQGDGHVKPDWAGGAWASDPVRLARWASLALDVSERQRALLPTIGPAALATAFAESAAEVLTAELEQDGLPIDLARAEAIIGAAGGPRSSNEIEATRIRSERDQKVLAHAVPGTAGDLRNPAQVKAMLRHHGIDVPDTRAPRLEPFRSTNVFVEALLQWRKAERIATTYGYRWLDENVRNGRLRGGWSASDGAAGRMTAQVGLHNLPAEMRACVVAGDDHVFVHADLGQIEPRVLAAVSNDDALIAATHADDLYLPIAERLRVDRPTAKIAVLGAMYGATTGVAGDTLRSMELAYPTAMAYLRRAERDGRAGRHLRTYGGRLVRMSGADGIDPNESTAQSAARGRYARNAMIQGAAAELFKAWAVTTRSRLLPFNGRIVMCLHDEILIHVPAERGEMVATLLEQTLADAARRWMPQSTVRYLAQASLVARWSDAK